MQKTKGNGVKKAVWLLGLLGAQADRGGVRGGRVAHHAPRRSQAGGAGHEQVNRVAVDRSSEARRLDIRVSREQARTHWHGAPHRSYTAQVRIRCDERRGECLSIRMFVEPLWAGAAHEAAYTDPYPLMRFRDMQPHPTDRIVRAACPGP